ncbi:hypothetical protein SAMN05216223_101747 [Actinacidiphila yanglinensis]|uniref:Uncharacterized protein n=1 Tax=Actinacidiphila yanglinensis TaxID=310779 RepID=A0A1H5U4P5_9ACTN|nr:hypothetical protein [Actinacidiphila yanglinensis]SEF69211.1 hypothetical protein SAMN05216223_101747 [Actinacidiphila yanglinensis]
MTSRIPRDTPLRLVPRRPLTAARRTATTRRSRPARPPEGTPSIPELARLARAELAAAVRLARWAGTGPGSAGPTGILPDATVREAAAVLGLTPGQIRTAWDRARLSGLIELHRGTARPGWRLRAWDTDDTAVLRGWVALFDAWSLAHPFLPPGAEAGGTGPALAPDPALVAEVIEAAPQLLSFLHLSQGPVPLDTLLDLLRQRVAELRTERHEPPAAGDPLPALLDWVLEAATDVGALRPRDPKRPDEAVLTPLGSWAVWVKLEQICVAAQGPAGNMEQSAETMLRACARLSPGPARTEYRAWLAARPVAPAVAELLETARGEDALLRGLAFEALRVVGDPAEPAVCAVVHEPTLRPYAVLWLAELDGGDPDAATALLTREEATWLWVDTAAAVADHGDDHLLVSHLETAVQGSVRGLLQEVREVGHPRTVQVLVALAAAHPDPALAKAVRKAAFQVHTGEA